MSNVARYLTTAALMILILPVTSLLASSLTLTELSSTTLLATLDGTSLQVTNTFTDRWTVTIPGATFLATGGLVPQWFEPGSTTQVNDVGVVLAPTGTPLELLIGSDDQIIQQIGNTPAPDGATLPLDPGLYVGPPIMITFFDHPPVPTPEPPTLPLATVGLFGLAVLRRRVSRVKRCDWT